MAAATSKPTSERARGPARRWLRWLAAVLGVLVAAAVGSDAFPAPVPPSTEPKVTS